MKKIKVLITDPRHHTVGLHSRYVPVGIGYIAAYMLEKIKSQNFEVKLSINPEEIFDLIDEWKPNIIGSSNYIWNADLSYRMCEYAKEINANTLCVLGGPEFPTGSGTGSPSEIIKNKCYEYLKQRKTRRLLLQDEVLVKKLPADRVQSRGLLRWLASL